MNKKSNKNENSSDVEKLESKIEELKKELEKCKKERDEYLEGWKRAKADFKNYKNNEEERLKSFKNRNQKEIIGELITILDSFDLSVLSTKDDTIEKEGVQLIKSQLENILKKHGLERIKVSVGDEFNPELHEAIAKVESDNSEDQVVEIVEAGYKISDKVLRPSKVKVSK